MIYYICPPFFGGGACAPLWFAYYVLRTSIKAAIANIICDTMVAIAVMTSSVVGFSLSI